MNSGSVILLFLSAMLVSLSFATPQLRPVTAQVPPEEPVSGYYEDPQKKFSLTFPDGWSGQQIYGLAASVTPGGGSPFNSTAGMGVIPYVRNVLLSIAIKHYANMTSDDELERNCRNIERSFTTINDMNALNEVSECDAGPGAYSKNRSVYFLTESSLIGLMFSAKSSESYEHYSKDFTSTLSSLKIDNTMDIQSAISEIISSRTTIYPIKVDSQIVDVKVFSSSNLTNFNVDMDGKRITFATKVDPNFETDGVTTFNLQELLVGPFRVTMDGKPYPTDPSNVIENEQTGEKLIKLTYSQEDHHDFTVSGTQIIPEFPLATISLAVSMVALTAVITVYRLKHVR